MSSPVRTDRPLITPRGLAVRSGPAVPGLAESLEALGTAHPAVVQDGASVTATWGLPAWPEDEAMLLSAWCRRHDADASPVEVRRLVLEDPASLGQVMPIFAAAARTPSGGTSVATDYLGFRHVFHGEREGTAIVSTSSHACALELGSDLDLEAVAVQSSLGWQLDQRTLFGGIRKLGPGEIATLENGRVDVASYLPQRDKVQWRLEDAVRTAADVLRTYLAAFLDDHPDAHMQLTGGQDSRLLLSAIPRARRRGMRVVTLGLPGIPDADIAAGLAARYGMEHQLVTLSGLEELDPAAALELCLAAARRLDYSADPLAHAALSWVEARCDPGPRISGLGGEVARGFYYLGRPTSAPVTPQRARRLAHWRMFVNEGVPPEALDASFGRWARDFATHEVQRVLRATGHPWMVATDELYLGHRMQRWGGVTETAVCLDREIVNPMLDDRFISIATDLAPGDKRSSRFLSRLQLQLDPELGSIPLDGRPAPAAYAHRSVHNSAQLTAATLHKARRKVQQRVQGATRPPAGGEILAGKVVAHWRENPALVEPLDRLGVFDSRWLEALLTGDGAPPTSAVSLMVNLLGAAHPQSWVASHRITTPSS